MRILGRSPMILMWGEERPTQNTGHTTMSNATLDAFLRSLLADDASLSFADLVIEISCHFDLDKEDAVAALNAWIDGTSDAVVRGGDDDDQGEVALASEDEDPDGDYDWHLIQAERANEVALYGDWT